MEDLRSLENDEKLKEMIEKYRATATPGKASYYRKEKGKDVTFKLRIHVDPTDKTITFIDRETGSILLKANLDTGRDDLLPIDAW